VATNATFAGNFAPLAPFTVNTSGLPEGDGVTSGGGTAVCGSNVTVCATPTASCYSFSYWTDPNSNVVSTSSCYTFTAHADTSLTAHFVLIFSYTIATTNSPAGGGSTTGGGDVDCGSDVTVCATPNACYSFLNWADQNSNVVSTSACYDFTVEGNEMLTANFAPVEVRPAAA